jgi:hypothetical protein
MIKDTIAACRAYAAENQDAAGVAVSVVLTEDVDTHCSYTSSTWNDGRPESKMFERSGSVPLHIPAGAELFGVCYVGRATGANIFEFIYGQAWYRTYMVDDGGTIFGCKSTLI